MFKRNLSNNLSAALKDTPVVLINGARQTGKSTLVQNYNKDTYISLDDANALAAAAYDPQGFIQNLPADNVIIDEIQHAPQLFRAIKLMVDQDRTPGKYLLTGSANILLLPQLAESLAGRMEILTLWPLSQGEIAGIKENFIDKIFASSIKLEAKNKITTTQLSTLLIQGGYPEILTRETEERRRAWFESYISTILQRDIRSFANIEGLTELPRLLKLLASRSSNLLNFAALSRDIQIPQTTLKRYLLLLETTFLLLLLPAWSSNYELRLTKSPKIHLNDSGLLCHLLGINEKKLIQDRSLLGKVLENFIVMELYKQSSWSKTQPKLFHFRTQNGQEVDIILENANGQIIGIEIKASNTVIPKDFKTLHYLAELTKNKFHAGIVLYTGEKIIAYGNNFFAVPIHYLWQAF